MARVAESVMDDPASSEASKDPVVFQTLNEAKCSECGAEIWKGNLLSMDGGQPLCMPCAGMGDLEFLPSGDTALTRRAKKHSDRGAVVVVRFSRARKRYERQGILVPEEAIAKAEQECSADASERAEQRVRGAVQRKKDDAKLVKEWIAAIAVLFPKCPVEEAREIAEHAAERGSGRVGRSAAGRDVDVDAVTLAVFAAVRHRHTQYDKLLARGVERVDARARVRPEIEKIMNKWQG